MALTPEQAQALLEKGWISDQTYNLALTPQTTVPVVEAPVMAPVKPKNVGDIMNQGAQDFVASVNQPAATGATASFEMPAEEPLAVDGEPERIPATQEVLPNQSLAALDQIQRAGMKQAELGYKQAEYEGGLLKGLEEQQARFQQRQNELAVSRQKALEEGQAKVRESEEAAAKMEPKDFWQDKSTGSKIAAAIAMAFGSYGATVGGGPNTAAQIIDGAVQRDMALQKEKYQRAKDKGIAARTALADNMAIFKDQESAELATMQNYYNLIGTKIKAFEAKTNSEMAKANAQKFGAEIDLKKAEIFSNLLKRQTQINMERDARKGKAIDPSNLDEKQLARFVDDNEFGGLARTEQAANKVSEALIEYRSAKDLLGVLNDVHKMPGKSISPEQIARAETAAAALKGKLRGVIVGPGAVSESEWKLLNSIVADPTKFMTLDNSTKQRLLSIDRILDSNMTNTARAYGITPKIQTTDSNKVLLKMRGENRWIPRANLNSATSILKQAGIPFEVSNE